MRNPLLIVLSGCSGGGKSTILDALRNKGFPTIDEPGRRIVRHEMKQGGKSLPWDDPEAFARAAIDLAIEDHEAARAQGGVVFFDRSLIDAASFLRVVTGEESTSLIERYPYARSVFLTPPWQEIYVTDAERKHGFDDAIAEYERLVRDYSALGYEPIILPKTGVRERVDFILDALEA
ncbi:AAA family ATPase [Limoniibacter endophyticus]|uniref:ATPase n=1 Tax=Limoniibacter endophyticus TaxID=1565040 RepID=A0A8J3DH89_9HYPH|nr:AAA family ATPase [Limoniibacter endophyticus]GHC66821.1 ATPase [Limoniibacter endophyticus]